MNKKEIRIKATGLLASGTTKAEVFAQLSGQGLKDSRLAYLIAAHADPRRVAGQEGKINAIITLMFLQAVLGFLMGYGMGAKIGPDAKWIVATLIALIPLLFAWGFYRNKAGAYNAYILLTLTQLPRTFDGFSTSPVSTGIGLIISLATVCFIWYVRDKLFPDFLFVSPRKVRGAYVFAG